MDVLSGEDIILYGAVGESFFEPGFTARDVINALAKRKGKDVSVRINSGGGYSDEGVAIYNSLKAHNGKVTVYVDGIAASAASLIAMAGSEIVMRTGSTMMVHDPMMISVGNADDMAKAIEQLNACANSMADIYADKTGRKATEIRAEMREELWLTPDEAIAKGYADRRDSEEAIEASAFDYRAYAKAPERMVALSDMRQWSNRLKKPVASAAQPKETQQMADTVTKEAAAAQAEASATEAAAKARTEESARTSAILAICAEAEALPMAAALISEGITAEQAKVRISSAKEIRAAVELARVSCKMLDANLADKFIAAGTSIEKVRSDLFECIVAVENAKPTRSAHSPYSDAGKGGELPVKVPNAKEIYAKRKVARENWETLQ